MLDRYASGHICVVYKYLARFMEPDPKGSTAIQTCPSDG